MILRYRRSRANTFYLWFAWRPVTLTEGPEEGALVWGEWTFRRFNTFSNTYSYTRRTVSTR